MIEILKYTIPSLIVLLATWIVMYKLFQNEQQKREWELRRLAQKEISPIRLRAYERLCLLLERTTPERMLGDMNLGEMTILDVQQQILRTLKLEYDHNLSQQIYVSDEVWQRIINARDQMAAFAIAMTKQVPADANAQAYAQVLITAYHSNGDTPNQLAMDALKQEAAGLL